MKIVQTRSLAGHSKFHTDFLAALSKFGRFPSKKTSQAAFYAPQQLIPKSQRVQVCRKRRYYKFSKTYPMIVAEASLPNFNIPYREKLAFHVKNRENGKTVNFPVVTIPCKLHGFSQTQIEVDVTTSLTFKVPSIYRELVSHWIYSLPKLPSSFSLTAHNRYSTSQPAQPVQHPIFEHSNPFCTYHLAKLSVKTLIWTALSTCHVTGINMYTLIF